MRRLLTAAIHLVLLMAVTASVIAENAPKRQTNNLNLPPEAIDFDLSDLIDADQKQRDQKQRDEWTAYQDKMTAAYAETKTFVDSGSDTAAGIEAWQRFLAAFDADNPFNKQDESLREDATEAMLKVQEIERTLQAEWSDYQDKMTKAYQEVLAFLKATRDSKLEAQSVNRFLEAFSADNPFSEEDDAMRNDARRGLTSLELVVGASKAVAKGEPDTLAYLYEPVLGERQQSMAQRIRLHARNAEFDAAISLSQDLLDSADPLRDVDPSIYGQVMTNHGILHVAVGEYQLGLSIIERGMQFLEARTNPFDEILINSIMAKGICQLLLGSFTDAEDTFRRAQKITHRHKGVYNKEQLPMISYLAATNLRQRNSLAADQQQRFSLKVAEQSYGPNSIEILPTLTKLGSYFASRGDTIALAAVSELRSILFKDSVNLYHRAIDIIELNYGVNDPRLLTPLRGLASARMLEITQRRYAEAALLRSLEIVDSNPNSDLTDRAQALVDLGDFYIITSDEKARETYLSAWTILQETPETQQLASSLFGSPVRLYPRNSPFLYLERTPDGVTAGDQLFANLQYDVSPDGHVRKIEVIDKNVPIKGIRLLRQILRASLYRPRIDNGELVSTEALQIRQLFAVLRNKPLPDDKQEEEDELFRSEYLSLASEKDSPTSNLSATQPIQGKAQAQSDNSIQEQKSEPYSPRIIPARMGVYYSDNFRYLMHEEVFRDLGRKASPLLSSLSIDLGEQTLAEFQNITKSLFAAVEEVHRPPLTTEEMRNLDGVFIPSIEKYGFLTPSISGLKFYSASIEYRVAMYDKIGAKIGDWNIVGYGESEARRFSRRKKIVNEATALAIRDAGARIADELIDQPAVQAWLQSITVNADSPIGSKDGVPPHPDNIAINQ